LAPEIAAILADEIEDVEQGKSNDALRRPDAAIRALVRCGPAAKAAFPTVLPWLTGSDQSKFDWGMRIVEASGAEGAEAVSFLAESLTTIRTHNLEAKSAATRSLGGGQTSPTLRVLATLGKLGPKANAALPKLETFLLEQTSDDSQVATATREAIKRIRPPEGDQSPQAPK